LPQCEDVVRWFGVNVGWPPNLVVDLSGALDFLTLQSTRNPF
jgi:hypothetical protein